MTDLPDVRFTRRAAGGGVTLNVAEAGPEDGPLVILLHGFPEFWFGWRHQIGALASAGHRVVAPDQRGYNLSDKPDDIASYDIVGETVEIVVLDSFRLVRQIVAALIGHHDAITGARQGADLVAPAEPEFGKAMQQDDGRPAFRPRFGDVQRDAYARNAAREADIGQIGHREPSGTP